MSKSNRDQPVFKRLEVEGADREDLRRLIVEAVTEAWREDRVGRGDGEACTPNYDEPGPNSKRKWFTVKELMERWQWSRSKVYEIPAQELPSWRKGKSRRFFWAHVWAFEGRISREKAEKIHLSDEDAPHALQARRNLPGQVPESSRLRPLS